MIINSQIWKQTIEAAKTKSAGNAAVLRAIDRAVVEIEHSAYWSFDGQTLRIQSTTSKKMYVVDDNHTCEARSKTCKHHIARRLMIRYTQALGVAAAEVETKRASMMAEADKATLVKRTVRGESYNGIDI